MSSSNDRYYGSLGKSSRSPSAGDTQGGFFQTGQGGRTVLPPLSSAFPTSRFPVPHTYSTQYSQPRSSPGRTDYNPSFYGQWTNTPPTQQNSTSFTYYDNNDPRYTAQAYPTYPSRESPGIPSDPHSRRLPPLSVSPSSTVRDERWQQTPSYPTTAAYAPSMGSNIRSPTAAYPSAYAAYPTGQATSTYSYPAVPDPRQTATAMNSHSQMMQMVPATSADRMNAARNEVRATSTSPYARNQTSVSPPTYTAQQPPSMPTEEPMIKKKRKRADANQLKVLNETYNRTAFPSTEERAELARKLDMSARSVQIWFQNKRQSMRQTSRQTANTVSPNSHQQFGLSSPEDAALLDDPHSSTAGYNGSSISNISGTSYLPRLPSENSRTAVAHNTLSPPIPHRRPRGHDESVDPRKWNRGY